MKIASFTSNIPTMGDTRTYEDFYKYLGVKPTRLGIISRMYDDLTASFLTESLKNIFYQDAKGSGNKYQSVNALAYDWEITTNYIKRIEFAAVPEGDGAGGTEIIMAFRERYYEKYDTFKIENSGQQCMVVSRPIRKGDNYWEVAVRLVDNNYDTILDVSACQPGDKTRWISAHMPELHEEGYVKWQSNVEKHRGYIQTHRFDASYSALYAAQEDVFIKIAEGKDQGNLSETIYKMDTVQKNLLETFLVGRNQALLFSKGNVDPRTEKPTIVDPDTNRPIYISDGLIPQVEAYASKYAYNKLTINVFKSMLQALNEKAEKPTGNHYVFIVNEKAWYDIQDVLDTYLAQYHTDGTYLWSAKAGEYVSVGAKGFDTYNYGGNTISFKVDRTFSREFGYQKGYMLALDLTADKTSAQPPIALFTLKGGDMISNKYLGVGGLNGLSSGEVASPVAGSKLIMWGYSSLAVFNPYRSYVAREI